MQFQKISILLSLPSPSPSPTPTEGIGIPGGEGFSKAKTFKEMYIVWSLIGIFRGVGLEVLEKVPSVGELWIFSGTTQCIFLLLYQQTWKFKQLLDEVFVLSRIIKVKARVISCSSQRLRLTTLTETLIIMDITKTESNNCFIIHWTKKRMFLLLHWWQATQSAQTWHDYP